MTKHVLPLLSGALLWVAASGCYNAVPSEEEGIDAALSDAGASVAALDAGGDGEADAGASSAPDGGGGEVPDAGGAPAADAGNAACTAPETFSFFVMSLEAIQELSGSAEGFGGNLGGLSGADDKCQKTAEKVGSCRKWHAFLSVTDDGTGSAVNAIDRIGTGPWYDINGHLFAEDLAGLLHTRPDGDTTIVWTSGYQQWPFNQCLTTELGNCNHSYGDTHDTLTGSNRQGRLYSTDKKYTCNDWTSINVNVQLPIGHSWPRRLDGTDDSEANWMQAHSNCGGGGGPPGGGTSSCNGCAANINITDTMEDGVGGDGGYGAWYCFAYE